MGKYIIWIVSCNSKPVKYDGMTTEYTEWLNIDLQQSFQKEKKMIILYIYICVFFYVAEEKKTANLKEKKN